MNNNFNLKSMTINELSEHIGFSPSKIRYYENKLSIPIERNAKGRRQYTENAINIFQEIKTLTSSGVKLEELKNSIKLDGLTSALTSSEFSKVEILDEENDEKFNLVIKPFEYHLKQQQNRIERLLDRVEALQDEKLKIKSDYQSQTIELTAQNKLYESQIQEYRERLALLESKQNKKSALTNFLSFFWKD